MQLLKVVALPLALLGLTAGEQFARIDVKKCGITEAVALSRGVSQFKPLENVELFQSLISGTPEAPIYSKLVLPPKSRAGRDYCILVTILSNLPDHLSLDWTTGDVWMKWQVRDKYPSIKKRDSQIGIETCQIRQLLYPLRRNPETVSHIVLQQCGDVLDKMLEDGKPILEQPRNLGFTPREIVKQILRDEGVGITDQPQSERWHFADDDDDDDDHAEEKYDSFDLNGGSNKGGRNLGAKKSRRSVSTTSVSRKVGSSRVGSSRRRSESAKIEAV